MGQFVDDEAVEPVRRLVDRQHHALAHRLGERADAFLAAPGIDVLLLELAVGLEEDELHLERQVVLQVGADLLVRALGVARHALEVLLELGVVVDLEMVRRVDVPVELVVVDVVLPEVGDERRLRGGHAGQPTKHGGGQRGDDETAEGTASGTRMRISGTSD